MTRNGRVSRARGVAVLLGAALSCALAEEGPPSPEPAGDDWRLRLADERSRLRELRDRLSEEGGEDVRSWGATLIINRDAAAQEELSAARAAAEQAAWREAVAFLQKLCDRPPGSLVLDPADPRVAVPAYRAAERMILEGPIPLREAYRAEQENPAQRLVREALRKRDAGRLEEAARRWGATVSGAEARSLLVRILAGSDDFSGALRILSDMAARSQDLGEVKEPVWLLLLEEAARRQDLSTLRWLRSEAARAGTLGPEAAKTADRLEADARRTAAEGQPKRPVLEARPLWEHRAEGDPGGEIYRPFPALPLLAGAAVLFQDGRRLTVLDRESGKLKAQSGTAVKPYMIDYGPQVYHAVALSGKRAFLPLPDASPTFDHRINAVVALPTQDMHCFDAESGKLLWRAKEAARGKEPAIRAEESFPSPPAADGDAVYAPVTSFKGLFSASIARLAAADGVPAWRTFLCSGQQEMNYFGRPIREAVPSTPVLSQGRLVVCTNLGAVAAVDPRTGHPLWVFQYDQVPQKNQETRMWDIEWRLSGWKAMPPVVLGSKVLVAPTDSPYLYALDGATGRMLWRHDGQGASGIMADPVSGVVFVWGREGGAGLSAADGKMVWRSLTRARSVHPGNVSGGRFYLVADGRLMGFDATTGRVTCLVEELPAIGPVAVEGKLGVSLSMRTLAGWELVEQPPADPKPD